LFKELRGEKDEGGVDVDAVDVSTKNRKKGVEEDVPSTREELQALVKHRLAQLNLLEAERDSTQLALDSATRGLTLAKKRAAAFADARESEAALKRKAEQRVALVELELPELDAELSALHEELEQLSSQSELLQSSYVALLDEYRELARALADHPAFERWLERRVVKLSPVLRAALRKTSSALVMPLVAGAQTAAKVNHRLTSEVQLLAQHASSSETKPLSPLNKSSKSSKGGGAVELAAGIWFYLVLLCPLVLFLTLLRALAARVRRWRATHTLLLFSSYLSVLSCVCCVFSLAMAQDVLATLVEQHATAASHAVALHALLFIAMLSAQLREVHTSIDAQHLSQLLASLCLMLHFYIHAWRPVMLDELTTFGAASWALYAMVFSLVAVEKLSALLPSSSLPSSSCSSSSTTPLPRIRIPTPSPPRGLGSPSSSHVD